MLSQRFSYAPVPGDTSGYTLGNFSVTDAGSAVYNIPITASPGTGGMTPTLSLSYSSQGGNGLMGLGWSVNGISTISRGTRTLAQDGVIKGVSFDTDDTYNLDGERLVWVNSPLWAGLPNTIFNNREYRTEQNAFMRITAKGNGKDAPNWFEVRTKSGLIMEYGKTPDSRIEAQGRQDVLFWVVNEIRDTKGNYIRFVYEEDSLKGEYRPIRIEYTGNRNVSPQLMPYNSVEFIYESRQDTAKKFLHGSVMRATERLSQIRCLHQGQVMREYCFSYLQGKYTKLSLLASITECGRDGHCFEPTTFHWMEEKDFGYEPRVFGGASNKGIPTTALRSSVLFDGDFNGDGLTDFFRYDTASGDNKIYFNSGNFDFSSVRSSATAIPTNLLSNGVLSFNDFNSDGFTDVLWYDITNGTNRWFRNNKNGTTGISFTQESFSINSAHLKANNLPGTMNPEKQDIFYADFNGDGKTDFFTYQRFNGAYHFYKNTSNGTQISFSLISSVGISFNSIKTGDGIYPVDWDGDGLTDLMWYERSSGTNRWFRNTSDGSGNPTFSALPVNRIPAVDIRNGSQISLGDWNGDGMTDIMWFDKANNSPNNNKWWLNKGDFSFERSTIGNLPHTRTYTTNTTLSLSAIDFNGDGATDFIWYTKNNGENRWFLNDGHGRFTQNLDANSNPGADNPIVKQEIKDGYAMRFGAFTEEGLLDVLWYDNKASGATSGANYWYGAKQTRYNLMDSIRTGHGRKIGIHYGSLTADTLYEKGQSSIYPFIDFEARFHVVESYQVSNGVGGFNRICYRYKGAVMNLNGRGFRGFQEISMTDLTTGITTNKFFEKDHKFIGAPVLRSETRLPNGTLLSETVNTNQTKAFIFNSGSGTATNNKVHFSFVEKNVAKSYEIDGTLISTVTTTTDYDDYGNVVEMVVDYGDGHKDSTYNHYADNYASWILGRLSRSQVTRYVPGQSPVYKEATFEYDLSSGLLTKEVSEAQAPAQQRITKTYIHDDYGNILQSTVTAFNGSMMENRNTYTAYDSLGRFTTSVSNDLGHTVTRVYDEVFGLVIAETDENGLTNQTVYDPFGREIYSIGPDSNWVRMDYRFCSGGNCPPGAVFFVKTQSSVAPPSTDYFDVLDRVIRSEGVSFDGTTVYNDNIYNSRGQVTKASEPYFQGSVPVWNTFLYDTVGREIERLVLGVQRYATSYSGLTTQSTNPLGQTQTVTTNVLGRPIQVLDNMGNVLAYTYDARGNVTKIINPEGHDIEMAYDLYDNKIYTKDPSIGEMHYQFNAFGELLSQVDARGDSIWMKYDILGRIIQRGEKEGLTIWTYDSLYMGIGKLASVKNYGIYEMHPSYDSLGRPFKQRVVIDTFEFITSNSFDTESRPDSINFPSGFSIKNEYNSQGYLFGVKNTDNSNYRFWKLDQTNAKGQILKQRYGNGIETYYTYNPFNDALRTIISSNIQGAIQDLQYGTDDISQITFREDKLQNLIEEFHYDSLNRLIFAGIQGLDTTTHQYDRLGNITYKSDVGHYFYGENGAGPYQLTRIEGLDSLACLPGFQTDFTYNSFRKVSSMENDSMHLEIVYGASRQRILQRKYKWGQLVETKMYVGPHYEVTLTDSTQITKHYIRGNSGVVAVFITDQTSTSQTHFWHKDHLGSIDKITDDQGTIVENLSFDAWGKRRNADWTTISISSFSHDRGFTGHEHLNEFGLINMNGRVYDPVVGRFLSPDPFIQNPSDLQNLNRYSYVFNNPLSYSDPSGFFGKKWRKKFRRAVRKVKRAVRKGVKKIGGALKNIAKGQIRQGLKDLGQAYIDLGGLGEMWKAGQKAFGDDWNTIVVVGASIGVGIATGGLGAGLGYAIISGAASGFTGSFVGVMVAGGTFSDALKAGAKGAAIGAVTAAATFGVGVASNGIGDSFGQAARYTAKAVGHGLVQGASAELQGGKFEHGFMSGAVTGAGEYLTSQVNNKTGRVFIGAFLGGTSSELGGGKFANGAISGAVVIMYNNNMADEIKKLKDEAIGFLKENVPKVISGGLAITYGVEVGSATTVLAAPTGPLAPVIGIGAGAVTGAAVYKVTLPKAQAMTNRYLDRFDNYANEQINNYFKND